MALSDDLVTIPQREVGGSLATSRLDYQAQWALCLVFKKHLTGDDYAIATEFHDDVILLDSSTDPNAVQFFQVKTKSGPKWTLANLYYRKKGDAGDKLASYMGKLFDNYRRFPNYTTSLSFVSNAPCSVLNPSVGDQPFSSGETADFAKFQQKLIDECSDAESHHAELFRFVITDLSLGDSDGHLQGKLVNFVRDTIGPNATYQPDSLYRLVTDEFRQRAKNTQAFSSFDELIKFKAVSRKDVESWLQAIRIRRPPPTWSDVSSALTVPPLELGSMRKEWTRYTAEVLNPGNPAILKVRDIIVKMLEGCDSVWSWDEIFEFAKDDAYPASDQVMPGLTLTKFKVMILYEVYVNEGDPEIQATDAQPEKAEK